MNKDRSETQHERALRLLKKRGIMRLSELKQAGVHYQTLARMVDVGAVVRQSRGIYQLPDADLDLSHGLAEAAKAVPKGVICLISALQFHELTLQVPPLVWIAVGRKQKLPRIEFPPIHPIRFGEKAMSFGIERHVIDGVETPIFNPTKTVVDCFRYRKQVGLDVALEGLRNSVRRRQARPDDIVHFAKTLRIWSVIRPYLDATLADEG